MFCAANARVSTRIICAVRVCVCTVCVCVCAVCVPCVCVLASKTPEGEFQRSFSARVPVCTEEYIWNESAYVHVHLLIECVPVVVCACGCVCVCVIINH